MSVIIRLQNLPWSANALDIRNFFRGLSIPEGGVHIVGGELGDAFIAFSTDEDARQAMMLDGGKIKEIQVKLLLSSRSEMHKVIEAARQSVPILSLAPAPAPAPAPAVIPPPAPAPPAISPFTTALGNSFTAFGIPGIGNPQEIPQPAVIEPPAPLVSPPIITPDDTNDAEERRRSREKDRRRSRSRSRSRDRKDRKRDRRDRSRSRDRRRRDRSRDRSRSRDRRIDRKRDRKERSRSRDRSGARRRPDRKSPSNEGSPPEAPQPPPFAGKPTPPHVPGSMMPGNGPILMSPDVNRFDHDPQIADAYNKLHELGKKRNPNAFQGELQQQNGGGRGGGRGGRGGGAAFRREGRRFDGEHPRDCCVAVRGAPTHTSYGDVRRFFPFMIDKHGIKMINDPTGRRTGNIYVRFCDARSKHLALQRKNNQLKGAEVTVQPLDDEAYEAAVDSFLPFREEPAPAPPAPPAPDPPFAFTVLKLTDLPHFVKEHDIIKSFSDYSLLSITLNDCRATRTKTAFVQFAKPEDARTILERKGQLVFGRRQATVEACSDADYEREKAAQSEAAAARARPEPEPAVDGPRDPRQRRAPAEPPAAAPPAPAFAPAFAPAQQFPPPFAAGAPFAFPGGDPRAPAWPRPAFPPAAAADDDDEPLDCVLMKGLPRDATDRTIVAFLADTGAVPARIHLMLDAAGAPSGDCFCEFRSVHEARLASAKHGHGLDGCRVTVDLVARSVVEEALEGPKRAEPPPDAPPAAAPPFFDDPRAFQPRAPFRPRGGFDRGFERGGYRGGFDAGRGGFDAGHGGYDNGRGGYDGGRGRFESGRGGYERSERGYRGRGGFGERGGRGFERGRGRGFGRGRGGGGGGFENGAPRDAPEESDPGLEDFGAPGCVVSMENVPFRATVDEILHFFSEFELTQDDVIRRYNERGQPTGDARVAFRTPFDAQRAVKTRHMDTIHDRRINLTIL